MAASTNKRIFYAVQVLAIKGDADNTWAAGDVVKGVQSVSTTTSFNLNQVFQLGQIGIYENVEGIPNIEFTATKVLDGRALMWHMATVDASLPTLVGRSTSSAVVGLGIYPDTAEEGSATNPTSEVEMSGMFVSSLTYTFPLDSPFTEDVTMVGNNKIWANDTRINAAAPGQWSGSDTLSMAAGFTAGSVDSPNGLGGVNFRENLLMVSQVNNSGADANGSWADPNVSVFPQEIFGISTSGLNLKSVGDDYDVHFQSITVSVDLGRTEQFELGRRGTFNRTVDFPTEVTCEFEITATSGDMISAIEGGILATGAGQCDEANNLTDRTIRIATCEGTRLYLGIKNKLASVSYGGGDAGGGNVSVTYSYSTFNDLTVIHSGDPNSNGTAWWDGRGNHLVTL